MGEPAPHILDCTLRDGSYAINFQFTANDTRTIARALENARISLIEIGHGVGLGATEAGFGQAAASDEDYMRAISDELDRAGWGMFCIPGIAKLHHVELAAGYGMDFIRIGTNVDNVDDSRPFIEKAKQHGMMVCANYMKSYASPPRAFAKQVKKSVDFGADLIYIVDSAGGMTPADIERYVSAIRECSDIPIGFHGHDNLGLAMANSLKAMELGAMVVDASLQGFGRSGGNTATERLACIMNRLYPQLSYELLGLMDAGEEYIRPLITRGGHSSIDTISGHAQFHSSYMGIIREYSSRYQVDPRELIMAVTRRDKVEAAPEMVEEEARRLAETKRMQDLTTTRFGLDQYHGDEQYRFSLLKQKTHEHPS